MENFSNSVLIPENLPTIEKKPFTPLDKKYLRILYLQKVVFFLVLIGGFTAFLIFTGEKVPFIAIVVISAALLCAILYSSIITHLGFPKKGYLLRESDISFQKGLLVYKVTTVPFNRIQHVELTQGILAKAFNLSSLKLYTAGGNASDLSIPGLPRDTAQNLKTFLSEKISAHE